jgi:hypothetical protein
MLGISLHNMDTDLVLQGRASEDNINIARGIVIDQAVAKRSERRQNIIGEILATEKDYLDDIQALIRVCCEPLCSDDPLTVYCSGL